MTTLPHQKDDSEKRHYHCTPLLITSLSGLVLSLAAIGWCAATTANLRLHASRDSDRALVLLDSAMRIEHAAASIVDNLSLTERRLGELERKVDAIIARQNGG